MSKSPLIFIIDNFIYQRWQNNIISALGDAKLF